MEITDLSGVRKFVRERKNQDWSIDRRLTNDCIKMMHPYRGGVYESVFVLDTILDALHSTDLSTGSELLSHSLTTGIIYGVICKQFYHLPDFFVGLVAGLVHDVGKVEDVELFNTPRKFTAEEKKRAQDHVAYTSYYLGDDYPWLNWLVSGHHLHGQPDGLAYPKQRPEDIVRMLTLQRALSVADKSAASIEMRPELTPEEKEKRKTFNGIIDNINRLYEWFKPENSVVIPKQIDFVKKILQQKMVLTPYFEGTKISTDDLFAKLLISNGNLKSDGSRLEINILNSPLVYGIDLARFLAKHTMTKHIKGVPLDLPLKVSFEPVDDIKRDILYKR